MPVEFQLREDNYDLKGAYQLLKISQKYVSFIREQSLGRIKKKNQLLYEGGWLCV